MAVRKTPSEGRKSGDKLMRDALMISLHREAEKGKKTKRLQIVADKLVDAAMDGDVPAIKEIFDRVDGKVPQALTGEDGKGPVLIKIVDDWARDLAPK